MGDLKNVGGGGGTSIVLWGPYWGPLLVEATRYVKLGRNRAKGILRFRGSRVLGTAGLQVSA